MGFLTNSKTGKRMKAEELIARETTEWIDALGVFAKECMGASKAAGKGLLFTTEKDLVKMLNSMHNYKGRR